jgi:hypothetical protein
MFVCFIVLIAGRTDVIVDKPKVLLLPILGTKNRGVCRKVLAS